VKCSAYIIDKNETFLRKLRPAEIDESGHALLCYYNGTTPVLLRLAGIQLLDHGAPPQHEFNSSSAVLLLDLFLKQLSRVATLS
jgi:hypothetical protein